MSLRPLALSLVMLLRLLSLGAGTSARTKPVAAVESALRMLRLLLHASPTLRTLADTCLANPDTDIFDARSVRLICRFRRPSRSLSDRWTSRGTSALTEPHKALHRLRAMPTV